MAKVKHVDGRRIRGVVLQSGSWRKGTITTHANNNYANSKQITLQTWIPFHKNPSKKRIPNTAMQKEKTLSNTSMRVPFPLWRRLLYRLKRWPLFHAITIHRDDGRVWDWFVGFRPPFLLDCFVEIKSKASPPTCDFWIHTQTRTFVVIASWRLRAISGSSALWGIPSKDHERQLTTEK